MTTDVAWSDDPWSGVTDDGAGTGCSVPPQPARAEMESSRMVARLEDMEPVPQQGKEGGHRSGDGRETGVADPGRARLEKGEPRPETSTGGERRRSPTGRTRSRSPPAGRRAGRCSTRSRPLPPPSPRATRHRPRGPSSPGRSGWGSSSAWTARTRPNLRSTRRCVPDTIHQLASSRSPTWARPRTVHAAPSSPTAGPRRPPATATPAFTPSGKVGRRITSWSSTCVETAPARTTTCSVASARTAGGR